MGVLASGQGNAEAARPRYEESIALFRAVGDRWMLALALTVAYEKIGAWFMDLTAQGKIVGGNELSGTETARTVRLNARYPV